jgi:hypothetical protein
MILALLLAISGAAALVALLGGRLWVKIKPGDGLQGRVAESRSGC